MAILYFSLQANVPIVFSGGGGIAAPKSQASPNNTQAPITAKIPALTRCTQVRGMCRVMRSPRTGTASSVAQSGMVKAMIDLAFNLGMTPLAEGVETHGELEFLIRQGCPLAQGAHPRPHIVMLDIGGEQAEGREVPGMLRHHHAWDPDLLGEALLEELDPMPDEPTVGLHYDDVAKLIQILQKLVERGNSGRSARCSRSTCPMISPSVRAPIRASSTRTSSAMRVK